MSDTTTRHEEVWVEPRDLPDARAMLDASTAQVVSIQNQLGDRNVTREGRRLSDHEWNEWRQRAKAALRYESSRQRRLKTWIRDHSTTTSREELLLAIIDRLDVIIGLLEE